MGHRADAGSAHRANQHTFLAAPPPPTQAHSARRREGCWSPADARRAARPRQAASRPGDPRRAARGDGPARTSRRRQHTRLAHAAAQHLAQPPAALRPLARAGDHRAHRARPGPWRSSADTVRRRAPVRAAGRRWRRRVPDARAVEVQREPARRARTRDGRRAARAARCGRRRGCACSRPRPAACAEIAPGLRAAPPRRRRR